MGKYVKNFGEYSVKKVKSFMGREGLGYNCDLYRGSKKIGFCMDDAGGGGMYPIEWVDKSEEKLFNDHVASLPKVKSHGMDLTIDQGWFVEELVNEFELQKDVKKMRKQCETKTLYRPLDAKQGQYYIHAVPYSEQVKGAIIKKHGEKVEIFNEVLAAGKIPSVLGTSEIQ